MNKNTSLKVGYYKFISLKGDRAEAEYKTQLTANLKIVCDVNIAPLFDTRSIRPQVKSLYRKLIYVNSVSLTQTGEVDYCEWDIVLTVAQLEALKAKELASSATRRIETKALTEDEALKLYDQIKANPENILPDALEEQCTLDDYDSDDYETDETGSDETDPQL